MLERLPSIEKPWSERFAIILKDERQKKGDGKLRMIGIIGPPKERCLGYMLHPEFWGKGYMTEGLKAYLELFWENKCLFSLSSF